MGGNVFSLFSPFYNQAMERKGRTGLGRALALGLAFALIFSAVPVSAQQVNLGWRLAALYVPGSAMPEGMEDRLDGMAFTFVDERKAVRYEVLVDKDGQAFLQRELTAYTKEGSAQPSLGTAALASMLQEQKGAIALEGIFLLKHEGAYSYMAVYTQPEQGSFYRELFNAADAGLQHSLMKPLPAPADGVLAYDDIKASALRYLDGGVLLDVGLEKIGAGMLYFVTLFKQGMEFRLTLDASSGEVIGDSARLSQLMLPEGTVAASSQTPAGQDEGEGPRPTPALPAATQRPASPPSANPPPQAPLPTKPPAVATQVTPRPTAVPASDDDDELDDDDEFDDDERDDDEWDDWFDDDWFDD